MLRDDLELVCGRLIEGSLTPALFLLLKDSPHLDQLCRDLDIEEDTPNDTESQSTTQPGPLAAGGLSLADWLAHNGEPVSL